MQVSPPIEPKAVRGLTRAEFDKLVALGAFADEKVELLYGVLVHMPPPMGPEHSSHVARVTEKLVLLLHGRAIVRPQCPLAASDESEPEPDIAVVAMGDYEAAHPERALLVVEVSDSSLARDRQLKAKLYAESGVPEYWIVNLVDRVIEVHTDIASGAYTRVTPYRKGERIRLRAIADAEVEVDSILR